ncbi:MAG TPA: HD domain-containing protein [Lactobacillaceae bacterium]|jgi:uncharacterized protein
MTSQKNWRDDALYQQLIADLLPAPAVQMLGSITQHHFTTRLEHSLRVSYWSYRVAKLMRLDVRAIARAGLLHDLFYYDWRTTKFDEGSHAYMHPRIALKNAQRLTRISDKEADIIVKHMFGATPQLPKYAESWVVSLVDDVVAIREYIVPKSWLFMYKVQMSFA